MQIITAAVCGELAQWRHFKHKVKIYKCSSYAVGILMTNAEQTCCPVLTEQENMYLLLFAFTRQQKFYDFLLSTIQYFGRISRTKANLRGS